MATIQTLKAREILDSRGEPTVEVALSCGGAPAVASVPAGASTGRHEAVELRDNDARRYAGRGVLTAVEHINAEIANTCSAKNSIKRSWMIF